MVPYFVIHTYVLTYVQPLHLLLLKGQIASKNQCRPALRLRYNKSKKKFQNSLRTGGTAVYKRKLSIEINQWGVKELAHSSNNV